MKNEWLENKPSKWLETTLNHKFFGLTTEQWKEKYGQDVITWMPITDARLAFYHKTQRTKNEK